MGFLGEPARPRANFLGTVWRSESKNIRSSDRATPDRLASILLAKLHAGFSYKDSFHNKMAGVVSGKAIMNLKT